jgi:hypothetical protein
MMNKTKKVLTRELEEQIRVYNELMKAEQSIIKVIEKFNGKVFNKRLIDAIEEELKQHKEFFVTCGKDSYNEDAIKFYNHNRSFKHDSNETYISTSYVNTNTHSIDLMLEDKRINAETVKKTIEASHIMLNDTIKEMKLAIEQFDDMLEEYNRIKELSEQFNKKYSYYVRETYNISFR